MMGKVGEIHENLSKSEENYIVLANDLENVDVAHFVFHILSKEKSCQCYVLTYCWQIGVRKKM